MNGGGLGGRGWHPSEINRLTVPQIYCLGSETPPGDGGKVRSFEEREEHMERLRAEEEEWGKR